MKRMGIFVFFDQDGKVDDYVIHLLDELNTITEQLIVVVNGNILPEDKHLLEKKSNQLFIRENKGFDAEAYGDIIVNVLGKEGLSNWDEIVFCNDTFYGPFISFDKIFDSMKDKNYDFWGLDCIKRNFLSYIIMYFCVFRGKMLRNGDLYYYFKKYIYHRINEIEDAFALFEVGLYYTLTSNGYKAGTYTYTCANQSRKSPDICILNYSLPIWKKKFFAAENYNKRTCERILNYLKDKKLYDTNYIKKNVQRLYGTDIYDNNEKNDASSDVEGYSVPQIKYEEVVRFLKENSLIYIYGAGSFARATYFVFQDHIEKFGGFVVSKGKKNFNSELWGHPVINSGELPIGSSIIVALNLKNSKEVANCLDKGNNILYFWKEIF